MAQGSRLDVAIVGDKCAAAALATQRILRCASVVLMEKDVFGTEEERGAVVARELKVRRALLADADPAH